ncbi:MAG: dTMP kinase [Woeseiaceae bacterium]
MTKANKVQPTGRFLSFEGVEAVGKTTTMRMTGELLDERGIHWIGTREPGGTPVAEALREIVLGAHDEPLTDTTELLLMFAARSQSVSQVIRPALEQGLWVLCDRFTDATMAYQGFGRGFSKAQIRQIADWVHGDLWPHKTFLLSAPSDVIEQRMEQRHQGRDRIEQQPASFFSRVAAGYQQLAADEPNRFLPVDTGQSLATVRERLVDYLESMINAPEEFT